MESIDIRALTPFMPTYPVARDYLRILEGVPRARYRDMHNAIVAHAGTPEEKTDWTQPDQWIPRRLEGEHQELALRLWQESNGELNPRYLTGPWLFSQTHELLVPDADGILQITERGDLFLAGDPALITKIDQYEGLLRLLAIIEALGPVKRNALYPDWEAFCKAYTGYETEATILMALRYRLYNLIDRELIVRIGHFYSITDPGAAYLAERRRLA